MIKISQNKTKMPSYPTCQNLGERLYFYEIWKNNRKFTNYQNQKSKNPKSHYEHRVPSMNPSFIYITICCNCFSNLIFIHSNSPWLPIWGGWVGMRTRAIATGPPQGWQECFTPWQPQGVTEDALRQLHLNNSVLMSSAYPFPSGAPLPNSFGAWHA